MMGGKKGFFFPSGKPVVYEAEEHGLGGLAALSYCATVPSGVGGEQRGTPGHEGNTPCMKGTVLGLSADLV